MGVPDLDRELAIAVASVRRAARACRAVQRDLVNAATLEKKDKSPVTVADFASQALVCAALAEGSAVSAIVGEEDAADLRRPEGRETREQVVAQVGRVLGATPSEERVLDWIDLGNADASQRVFWTLDPIDGTKGFLRGEHYAVALALLRGGEVVLGVLGCPHLDGPGGSDGALLAALRGRGAFSLPLEGNGRDERTPLRVSAATDPSEGRFCESVESAHSDQDHSARIAAELGITAEPVRVDSQAKYAIVARGEASIYLRLPTRKDYREKIWDHAAGAIVVEEAGGRVSDVFGAPLDFSRGTRLEGNRGVVATNGALHERVLEALAALQESRTV